MKKLGVDSTIFKEIISNKFNEKDISKAGYYKDILIKENVPPENVYIYGNMQTQICYLEKC